MKLLDTDHDNQKKPRKIVIGNTRKSIMAGGGINTQFVQGQNVADSLSIVGPANAASISQSNKQISRLNQQLAYYRDKNDQSLIKVRFLTQKLQSYGGLNNIPQTISNQISETDAKIKKLQQLLYFQRSKRMTKLKKKVYKFLQMLDFDINQQDLNKFQDQIQIILFLIDVFAEKYNNIITQKVEIDNIIENLKQDTVFNREQLQQQNKYLKQKNTENIEYIRDLQIQLFTLRKDSHNIGRTNYNIDSLLRNASSYSNSNTIHKNPSSNKVYQQAIKSLQIQNQNLSLKVNKSQSMLKNNQYQIINYRRKIQQYQHLLQNQRAKCRDLQQELLKVQRQEIRWRQRYEIMQRQKNQRIQLLERQKKTMENINKNYTGYQRKNSPDRFDDYTADKNGNKNQHNRNTSRYGEKYQINDGIIEDSGQQYFDM